LAENCPESASVEFLVIGNYGLGKWIVTAKDYMAPMLPFDIETDFLKGSHGIATRYPW
jgi:hypothetical protein